MKKYKSEVNKNKNKQKIVTLLEYIASSRDKGMKLKSTIENAVSKNL